MSGQVQGQAVDGMVFEERRRFGPFRNVNLAGDQHGGVDESPEPVQHRRAVVGRAWLEGTLDA